MKPAKKPASRKQLVLWLAKSMSHVPLNLCSIDGTMPPQWVKDAIAELKRNGFTYKSHK